MILSKGNVIGLENGTKVLVLTIKQVFARYTMGWWPGKLVALLNLIVLLGYSLLDCVVAGQILSAVSPNGSMSVVVGEL